VEAKPYAHRFLVPRPPAPREKRPWLYSTATAVDRADAGNACQHPALAAPCPPVVPPAAPVEPSPTAASPVHLAGALSVVHLALVEVARYAFNHLAASRYAPPATSSPPPMIATAAVRAAAHAGASRARQRKLRMPRSAWTPPFPTDPARRAMQRFPFNTGARLRPAPRSAVLHPEANHTRPSLSYARMPNTRRAPPTPRAPTERTVAAFCLTDRIVEDARTTSAPAIRVVGPRRPASAAARPQTTARIFVTLEATAPWTRIAARADIALPRWRTAHGPSLQILTSRRRVPAVPSPTIVTRYQICASTIRTALHLTRGQPQHLPVPNTHPALTTCRTSAGSVLSSFAALRDPLRLTAAQGRTGHLRCLHG